MKLFFIKNISVRLLITLTFLLLPTWGLLVESYSTNPSKRQPQRNQGNKPINETKQEPSSQNKNEDTKIVDLDALTGTTSIVTIKINSNGGGTLNQRVLIYFADFPDGFKDYRCRNIPSLDFGLAVPTEWQSKSSVQPKNPFCDCNLSFRFSNLNMLDKQLSLLASDERTFGLTGKITLNKDNTFNILTQKKPSYHTSSLTIYNPSRTKNTKNAITSILIVELPCISGFTGNNTNIVTTATGETQFTWYPKSEENDKAELVGNMEGCPLITGRLRVVDQQDTSKIWNIDRVLQGKTENDTTTVSVLSKSSPDKTIMVLAVNEKGEFSSKKPIRGSETNLINGQEYVLRATLVYKDHITVNNIDSSLDTTGCEPPNFNYFPRKSIRDSQPFIINRKASAKPINIDYPLPIVLLHGIRSCYKDWVSWTDCVPRRDCEPKLSKDCGYRKDCNPLLKHVSSSGAYEGFIVFTPNYTFRYPQFQITDKEAVALRNLGASQIYEQVSTDLNDLFTTTKPQAYFICHSNGGVVARIFSLLHGSMMRKIYTMGSPHSGTVLELELYSLNFRTMSEYNRRYPHFRKGIPILALGGIGNRGNADERNDGIVYPHKSVFNIGFFVYDLVGETRCGTRNRRFTVYDVPFIAPDSDKIFYKKDLPKPICKLPDFDPPTAFPSRNVPLFYHADPRLGIAGHPNFLDVAAPPMVFDAIIFPDMMGYSTKPLSEPVPLVQIADTVTQSTGTAFTDLDIPDLAPSFRIIDQVIEIKSNSTQEVIVPIPTTDRATFTLVAGKGAIALVDPIGKVIKPTNIQSYLGARYFEGLSADETITIDNPTPGNWKMRILSSLPNGKVLAMVSVLSDWEIAIDQINTAYRPSSPMAIRTNLTGDYGDLKVATVKATIKVNSLEAKDQDLSTVVLRRSSSGVYEGSIVTPPIAGSYRLAVEINGDKASQPTRQIVTTAFNVVPANRMFTGKFTDKLKDTDGNGVADQIIETIDFNIPSGNYLIAADLYDADNNLIGVSSNVLKATPGNSKIIELSFELPKIDCSKVPREFQIRNLSISDAQKGTVLDTLDSTLNLKYSAADFGLDCKSKQEDQKETKSPPKTTTTQDNVTQQNKLPPLPKTQPKLDSPLTFSLNGNLRTNIQVNVGDRVTVEAKGRVLVIKNPRPVYSGPEGINTTIDQVFGLIVKTAKQGVLLARVTQTGKEKWIVVGRKETFVAETSGVLELQVNDKKYEDNEEAFDVQVKIIRTQ